jgi:CMP-N,N'-diacetyllegionaminic acid synthase
MSKRILGIIPARGNSKEFPRKNLANFCGRPLLAWTILASRNSKYITTTIVSSDDDEILKISKDYKAETLKRPEEFAKDNSSSESVVKHAIDCLALANQRYDEIILLQPTSPLRTSSDIDNAYELMHKSSANSLVSVCKGDNKVLKFMKYREDGFLEGISNNDYPFMSRQDLPDVFKPNGAIYIVNVDLFNTNQVFFTNKTVSYVMPIDRSIDIDSKIDLKLAEKEMSLFKKTLI